MFHAWRGENFQNSVISVVLATVRSKATEFHPKKQPTHMADIRDWAVQPENGTDEVILALNENSADTDNEIK